MSVLLTATSASRKKCHWEPNFWRHIIAFFSLLFLPLFLPIFSYHQTEKRRRRSRSRRSYCASPMEFHPRQSPVFIRRKKKKKKKKQTFISWLRCCGDGFLSLVASPLSHVVSLPVWNKRNKQTQDAHKNRTTQSRRPPKVCQISQTSGLATFGSILLGTGEQGNRISHRHHLVHGRWSLALLIFWKGKNKKVSPCGFDSVIFEKDFFFFFSFLGC